MDEFNDSQDLEQLLAEQEQADYPLRSGYMVLPYSVSDDPKLFAPEILLYGVISGLAKREDEEGLYAFPSNKGLLRVMPPGLFQNCKTEKGKTKNLHTWLTNLQKRGHIVISRRRIGFNWERKIYPTALLKSKNIYHGQSTAHGHAIHDPSHTQSIADLEYSNIKNINNKRDTRARATPQKGDKSPPPPSESSPLLSLGYDDFKNVHLTDMEYSKLQKKFKPDVLKDLIDSVSIYKAKTNNKSVIGDYAYIHDFYRRQQKDKQTTPSFSYKRKLISEENIKEAKDLKKKVEKEYAKKGFKIHIASDYCELRDPEGHVVCITWEDILFKDKMEHWLTCRGIKV